MKNRWINLLFALIVILIAGLSFHLFFLAQTREAVGLIINILKPLNILLVSALLFVLSRNLLKLYLGYRNRAVGFRLQTKMVLALLPLSLLPAMAIFFLATSFSDDFLLQTIKNAEQTELLDATNDFTKSHFRDIKSLTLGHSEPLIKQIQKEQWDAIPSYLQKHGLQAIEVFKDDVFLRFLANPDFPEQNRQRLLENDAFRNAPEYTHFDDGQLLARYKSEVIDGYSIQFIYTMNTGFTQRYLFLRDSYTYLAYSQKKFRKLGELNLSILLITTLAIIFGGVWIALSFSRRFISAFGALIQSAQKIANGQLDTAIDLKTGDEMDNVIQAFNSMACQLKANHQELESKANDLARLNHRLEGEIGYNQTILQETRAGIMSTDPHGIVRTFNPAFCNILGLPSQIAGSFIETLLEAERFAPLTQQYEDYKTKGNTTRQLEIHMPDGETRHIAAAMVPLEREGTRFGHLIVIEDLTALLQAQKMAAWQDVAKRIAHEIKNPLTPIQLSIQRVARKASKDAPDLKDAVMSAQDTILNETNLLKNLVDEFSTFAKMPSPVKEEIDLAEIAQSVCNAYRPVHPNLDIVMLVEPGDYKASLDASQMRQVLSNLVNNAAQASFENGRITLGLEDQGTNMLLYVEDEGRGIPESEREKIFHPYYSKSPKGTGLGLAIVKRILEDHNGSIQALAGKEVGTRIAMVLPKGL